MVVYNAALMACQVANRWQLALQLWERMNEAGVEPDLRTFNTLISVFERANQMDVALTWYEELQLAGFTPGQDASRALGTAFPAGGLSAEPAVRTLSGGGG